MLADDGTLTCSCEDADGDNICDTAERGTDLDGNGIADDWDSLLQDGDTMWSGPDRQGGGGGCRVLGKVRPGRGGGR